MARTLLALFTIGLLLAGCTTPDAKPTQTTNPPDAARPEPTTTTSTTQAPVTTPPPATTSTTHPVVPAPPAKNATKTTVLKVNWSGSLNAWACAPFPTGGCAGPSAGPDDFDLESVAKLAAANGTLTLTWDDQTATQNLRIFVGISKPCDGDGCHSGYVGKDAIGMSPLTVTLPRTNATDKDTEGLLILVQTPNMVPDGVPAYGFVQRPTDFKVTGAFTVTTKA